MKPKFEWINEYVLTPILGLLFALLTPFIILWVGIKAVFGLTSKDSDRIEILRDVAFALLFGGVLFLIYWIFGFPEDY